MPSAGTLTGCRPQTCPVWMLGVACVTVPPLSDVSPSFMTEWEPVGGREALLACVTVGCLWAQACQWTLLQPCLQAPGSLLSTFLAPDPHHQVQGADGGHGKGEGDTPIPQGMGEDQTWMK